MMRIDELYLKDVGPFDELRLEFKPRVREDKADIAILTGANGCGKSTILYAIASLFVCGDTRYMPTILPQRLRSEASVAAFRSGFLVQGATRANLQQIPSPFANNKILILYKAAGEREYYYSVPPDSPFRSYRHALGSWQPPSPYKSAYAAFAYSGSRTLETAIVHNIHEPGDGPSQSSLSFHATAQAQRLADWIALMDYKSAGAHRDGDDAAVARYERTQRSIENAVGKIVGEEVRFIVRRDPLAVTLRVGTRETEFEVLPDGLKSILSWVADVLMRLERLPWVDETPPLQRPFLLLLDEIDIHLHPRWQRRILPLVQDLFPKAQIIASTHSPFVVTSVPDAWIYSFAVNDGKSTLRETTLSKSGTSYMSALRGIFQIEQEFDEDTEIKLREFQSMRDRVLRGEAEFGALKMLAAQFESCGPEVSEIVAFELHQVERRLAQAQPK